MNIELKHLAPYLPYGLKIMYAVTGGIYEVCGLNRYSDKILNVSNDETFPYEDIKPLLIPLSDLTIEQVKGRGYAYVETMIELIKTRKVWQSDFDWLCENHFDVFSLIEKGNAIDKKALQPS